MSGIDSCMVPPQCMSHKCSQSRQLTLARGLRMFPNSMKLFFSSQTLWTQFKASSGVRVVFFFLILAQIAMFERAVTSIKRKVTHTGAKYAILQLLTSGTENGNMQQIQILEVYNLNEYAKLPIKGMSPGSHFQMERKCRRHRGRRSSLHEYKTAFGMLLFNSAQLISTKTKCGMSSALWTQGNSCWLRADLVWLLLLTMM